MTKSMLWDDDLFARYIATRTAPSKKQQKQVEKKKRQTLSNDDLFDDWDVPPRRK